MKKSRLKIFLETAFNPWRAVQLRELTLDDYRAAEASLKPQRGQSPPKYKLVSLARFLLEETQRVVDVKIASIRSLEGKAIAQVGVAGTILALLAAFASQIPAGWKAAPLAFLLIAILAYVKAGYVRSGSLPTVGSYVTKRITSGEYNEREISLQLAVAWYEYGLELEQVNTIKANFMRAGNVWLQFALVVLVLQILFFGLYSTGKPGAVPEVAPRQSAKQESIYAGQTGYTTRPRADRTGTSH